KPIPTSPRCGTNDPHSALPVPPHIRPSSTEDAGELQPELLRQVANLGLTPANHVPAGFAVLPAGKAMPNRLAAPAHAAARLDDDDFGPHRRQVAGCRQAREASPGDKHSHTRKRHLSSND